MVFYSLYKGLHMFTSKSLTSTQRRLVWGVRIVLALAFFAAGSAKLAGAAPMVDVFEAIGAGQWFRYVTGAVETVAAVLLLVPATGFLGGLITLVTMTAAVGTHVFVIGGSFLPALVLALLSAFVVWQLRPLSLPALTR
jgi:putative oxidoreductase